SGKICPVAVIDTSSPTFSATPVSVNALRASTFTVLGPIVVGPDLPPVLRVRPKTRPAAMTTTIATTATIRPPRCFGAAAAGDGAIVGACDAATAGAVIVSFGAGAGAGAGEGGTAAGARGANVSATTG